MSSGGESIVSGTDDAVTEFVAALRDADAAMLAVRERLAAARVDDAAFGKLFEAHSVRVAYHERLPQMSRNFDEARAVLAHFVSGLTSGHRIVAAGRIRLAYDVQPLAEVEAAWTRQSEGRAPGRCVLVPG